MNQSDQTANVVIGRSGRAGSKPVNNSARIPSMEEAAANMPTQRLSANPTAQQTGSRSLSENDPWAAEEAKHYKYVKHMREKQNLPMAIFMGLLTSLIGAIIWATITAVSGYNIKFVALGVGFLVGMAVRYFGKGVDPVFGIVGAGFALFGCALGSLGSGYGMLARELDVAVGTVVKLLPVIGVSHWDVFQIVADPYTYALYIIAMIQGYKFSINEAEADF